MARTTEYSCDERGTAVQVELRATILRDAVRVGGECLWGSGKSTRCGHLAQRGSDLECVFQLNDIHACSALPPAWAVTDASDLNRVAP